MNNEVYINGYKLVLTCLACPEQYDVYDPGGRQVGYLRLRHGSFTVTCPDYGGDVVYRANPQGDGIFLDRERSGYLRAAIQAIEDYYINKLISDRAY